MQLMLSSNCLPPSGGAGAALDDRTDYDDAGFDDDGPMRPQRILHGRGNNWPITACTGLDLAPPARRASLSGGAGAALDDRTDYDDAGFDDDGPTRPPRILHGCGNTTGPSLLTQDAARCRRRIWPRPRAGPMRRFPTLPFPPPLFTKLLTHTHTQHLTFLPTFRTHLRALYIPDRYHTHTRHVHTHTRAHAPPGAAQLFSIPDLLQHLGL